MKKWIKRWGDIKNEEKRRLEMKRGGERGRWTEEDEERPKQAASDKRGR